jgi:hypothetical protein
MATQADVGALIRTFDDLICGLWPEYYLVPAGMVGAVREIYRDSLGGYRIEFQLDDATVASAVLYAHQFSIYQPYGLEHASIA